MNDEQKILKEFFARIMQAQLAAARTRKARRQGAEYAEYFAESLVFGMNCSSTRS